MTAISIDPVCNIATVEPGALNVAVKTAAEPHGLWYPPDPASFRISSIGSNVATNAGGLCCVKYGVTDYVLGLDVVQAEGTLLRIGGRTLKDVAGLPLVKLYVGSEGTLGVAPGSTCASSRCRRRPRTRSSLLLRLPVTRWSPSGAASTLDPRPSTLDPRPSWTGSWSTLWRTTDPWA